MRPVYCDESIWIPVADGLERRGWITKTARDEGMLGAPDRAQLAHAIDNDWLLLTFDDDFLTLVEAEGLEHARADIRPTGRSTDRGRGQGGRRPSRGTGSRRSIDPVPLTQLEEGTDDARILAYARRDGRIVITCDRRFTIVDGTVSDDHSDVIYADQSVLQARPEDAASGVDRIVSTVPPEGLLGNEFYLSAWL